MKVLDFNSQNGRTSPPGLSSQLWLENKSSGQNCVANVKLFVRGVVGYVRLELVRVF